MINKNWTAHVPRTRKKNYNRSKQHINEDTKRRVWTSHSEPEWLRDWWRADLSSVGSDATSRFRRSAEPRCFSVALSQQPYSDSGLLRESACLVLISNPATSSRNYYHRRLIRTQFSLNMVEYVIITGWILHTPPKKTRFWTLQQWSMPNRVMELS